jgi:hypothetical protein
MRGSEPMDDGRTSNSGIVLYIGGEGRSGSTVLATLLGNHDGFFPVGEFRDVWHALKTDELCSCGRPFSGCDLWRRVGERTFGGWDRVDVESMLKKDGMFARHRRIPRLLFSSLWWTEGSELSQYRELLGRLYAAVREVSGCSVIVDSTKDPAYALLLRSVSGLELRIVHLVRDSRGVAYSWSKRRVERPEYAHHPLLRDTFMDSRSSWKAALEWDFKNVLFHLLTLSGRHRVVTYESLMSEPKRELTHLLRLTGETRAASSEVTQSCREFESGALHMLGGNRVRFERGSLTLHADEEWRSRMSTGQKLIVGALTLPLLIAYGYVKVPAKLQRHSA